MGIRVLAAGDKLANAAVHLNQLGLRSAALREYGMWAPTEVVSELEEAFPNEPLPTLARAWDVVAISGEAIVDDAAREYADVAAASAEAALVISGVGQDGAAWLQLARKGAALLALSETELSTVEGWLIDETQSQVVAPPYEPALRDRAASLGEALGAVERICITRGGDDGTAGAGVCGAGLWCLGGMRPNGMKKPDPFFEHSGMELTSALGTGAAADGAEESSSSEADGASEAFLAALLTALLVDKAAPPKALECACALGAYVASSASAVPRHDAAPAVLRVLFRAAAPTAASLAAAAYGGEAERRQAAMDAMEAADAED